MTTRKTPAKSTRKAKPVASRSLKTLSLAKPTASVVRGGKVEAGGENIRRVKE